MGHLATTIWIICYFAVLLGLAGYGIHRYTMIFLYWRNRRKKPEPLSEFKDLPSVTVQLPIFNELHVVERLINAVSNLDYPKIVFKFRYWTTLLMKPKKFVRQNTQS